MKLHIYHNNAYDTVALVDGDKIVSHWQANAPGGTHKTVLEDALSTNDPSDWDDQGLSIDLEEFEAGNALYLVIREDGEWDVVDARVLDGRLSFFLGDYHPITKAYMAGRYN